MTPTQALEAALSGNAAATQPSKSPQKLRVLLDTALRMAHMYAEDLIEADPKADNTELHSLCARIEGYCLGLRTGIF